MQRLKLFFAFIKVFILSFSKNKQAKHKIAQIELILFDKPTHISHNDNHGTKSFLVKGDDLIEDLSQGLRTGR